MHNNNIIMHDVCIIIDFSSYFQQQLGESGWIHSLIIIILLYPVCHSCFPLLVSYLFFIFMIDKNYDNNADACHEKYQFLL